MKRRILTVLQSSPNYAVCNKRWIACRLLFSYGSSFGLHVQDFFLLTKKVAVVTTNVSLLLSNHVDMKISIVKSLNKNMVNNRVRLMVTSKAS